MRLIQKDFKKKVFARFSSSKALVYTQYGDPSKVLRLETQELPEISAKSVRVRMISAPINPADINTIQGVYPTKPVLPAVAGYEGVGEVIEAGNDVTQLKQGDIVIPAVNGVGTWRTELVCDEDDFQIVPRKTPLSFAAMLRVNNCTAYRMLADFVQLNPGDSIVQNGANSGVGQAVIQIAAIRQLKTINIIRDRPNLPELKSHLEALGATVVLTEAEAQKSDNFKMLPKPRLALNTVGGKSVIPLLKNLENGGIMVSYGGMSKQPILLPVGLQIFNDVKCVGFWMSRWHDQYGKSKKGQTMISELCKWAISGEVNAPPMREITLDKFQEALKIAMEPYISQKQVLRLS